MSRARIWYKLWWGFWFLLWNEWRIVSWWFWAEECHEPTYAFAGHSITVSRRTGWGWGKSMEGSGGRRWRMSLASWKKQTSATWKMEACLLVLPKWTRSVWEVPRWAEEMLCTTQVPLQDGVSLRWVSVNLFLGIAQGGSSLREVTRTLKRHVMASAASATQFYSFL